MSTYKFAIPSSDFQIGANLYGYISAVGIVNQVLKGNDYFAPRILRQGRVIIVVNGNKTDTKRRENLLADLDKTTKSL